MRPGFIGTSWSLAMRSVIGCSCEGKRVQQRTGPHMPPPPHWRAASRGLTWRTSTRVPRRLESGPATERSSERSSAR